MIRSWGLCSLEWVNVIIMKVGYLPCMWTGYHRTWFLIKGCFQWPSFLCLSHSLLSFCLPPWNNTAQRPSPNASATLLQFWTSEPWAKWMSVLYKLPRLWYCYSSRKPTKTGYPKETVLLAACYNDNGL